MVREVRKAESAKVRKLKVIVTGPPVSAGTTTLALSHSRTLALRGS
jgi:hypothetical protein